MLSKNTTQRKVCRRPNQNSIENRTQSDFRYCSKFLTIFPTFAANFGSITCHNLLVKFFLSTTKYISSDSNVSELQSFKWEIVLL